MPPVVEPTYGRAAISPVLSLANDYSGDYVVPDDEDAIAATAASIGGVDVTAGPHNAFAYDPGNSSGLTVRIDTGEAFVGGRYLVSDDTSPTRTAVDGSTVPVHDVDLPANATTTVSIGPDDRANSVATDQLIIGPDSAFPAPETQRLPLYDFTTDGSSVTSVTDRRRTGEVIDVSSVTTEQVDSDAINANRVFDSAGNYHGELTGTNDAQVVIDAIADRPAGAGVVIPNPGFPLDWEQTVYLPTAEHGFRIATVGRPKIIPNSSFTGTSETGYGNYAFFKPEHTGASVTAVQEYYLGPMRINDDNAVLDYGVWLNDIKRSYLDQLYVRKCPGICIDSPNASSTLNYINNPYLQNDRGPGIYLKSSGTVTNATWVVAPTFNDETQTQTAYVDEGNFNHWLYTHVERAAVAHEFDGAEQYRVKENDWDRLTGFDRTLVERNGAFGEISLVRSKSFPRMSLSSPGTNVDTSVKPTGPFTTLRDYFGRIRTTVPNDSFGRTGLTLSTSDGASVNYDSKVISLIDGPNASGVAEIFQGGAVFDASSDGSYPKLLVPIQLGSSTADNNAIFEIGFRNSNDDRTVVDWNDNEANSYRLRRYIGGSVVDDTFANADARTTDVQNFALQKELVNGSTLANSNAGKWTFYYNGVKEAEIDCGDQDIGDCEFFASLTKSGGASNTWKLRTDLPARLWSI
jgi:hypothetical protein